MSTFSKETVAKMMKGHGEFEQTAKLKLSDPAFGDDKKHVIEMDIYDGAAFGTFKNEDYHMEFPTKAFIGKAANMRKNILEATGHADEPNYQITALDILVVYNELYKDGVSRPAPAIA